MYTPWISSIIALAAIPPSFDRVTSLHISLPFAAIANPAAPGILANVTRPTAVSLLAFNSVTLLCKPSLPMAIASSKDATSTSASTLSISAPDPPVSLRRPPRHSSGKAYLPHAQSSYLMCSVGSSNGTDPPCSVAGRPVQPPALVDIIPPKVTVTWDVSVPTVDLAVITNNAPTSTVNITAATPIGAIKPTRTHARGADNNVSFYIMMGFATVLFTAVLYYCDTAADLMDGFIIFGKHFRFRVSVGDVQTEAIIDDRLPVVKDGNAVVDKGPIAKDGVFAAAVNTVNDVTVKKDVVADEPPVAGSRSMTGRSVLRRAPPPARIVCGRRYNKPRSLQKVTSTTSAKVRSVN
ncbi:hypothetical protein FPV67DRAFT_428197 [Lyophyllum atratum]|nr:hypothetical protein FPV67DRAFT_428197 [Lyophyllum atratum]